MSNVLLIIENVLDEDSWSEHQFDGSVADQLMRQYAEYPSGARLYHDSVSVATEITPSSEQDFAALEQLTGRFILVHWPENPWAMVAVFIVSLLVAVAFMPKPPNVATRNTIASSPNNELSARVNSARPNGRIPDIFGTVRSTPDLIALPYSTFDDNTEIENAVMCIGRGHYTIHDSYDGDTPISDINGASVEVYRPDTNIATDSPYYSVGSAIAEWPLITMRSNSVNGQTLNPQNLNSVVGNRDIHFVSDGTINYSGDVDLTERFKVGDTIVLQNAKHYTLPTQYNWLPDFNIGPLVTPKTSTTFEVENVVIDWTDCRQIQLQGLFQDMSFDAWIDLGGTMDFVSATDIGGGAELVRFENPSDYKWANVGNVIWGQSGANIFVFTNEVIFDLDGSYVVNAVTANSISVTPTAAWSDIPNGISETMSPTILNDGDFTAGPFYLDLQDGDIVLANLVALNGLYKDDGRNQVEESVTIAFELTRVNNANFPVGDSVTHQFTLTGSSSNRDQVGFTARIQQPSAGRIRVVAYRVTPTDREFNGQVVDEVKWRDLYHAQEMRNPDFGNVTVVRSRTVATTGALSVKERKLNLEVTREIPLRISDDSFTTILYPTNNAAEIFCAVCHDPMIGNRTGDDIDYDNIYDTVAEIETYFNSTDAAEFCYTIDKPEMTFEETLACIAQAIFSTAYRRGSVIRIAFEKLTHDSTLLFNHRNKLPGSENRTVRFGYENNYDGVEYKWVNPEDDAIETLTLGTAPVNSRKIESIGIRNYNQAYWQAWRAWNKIRYQNTMAEFSATAQSDLAVVGDRILVADNTRSDTQDGDIIAATGTLITTSQPLRFEPGHSYTMFLQMYDGTIEAIAVTPVVGEPYQANLAGPPSMPLVFAPELYTKTKYQMVDDVEPVKNAFLLTDRQFESNTTSKISAINYDPRYYANDPVDPIPPPVFYFLTTESGDNLVTENGDLIHTGA